MVASRKKKAGSREPALIRVSGVYILPVLPLEPAPPIEPLPEPELPPISELDPPGPVPIPEPLVP